MSWNDLAHMGLTVRPFDGPKPPPGYRRSQFNTSITKTLRLLNRELNMLGASDIVVELDIRERDIRLDGYPRADAKALGQAVRISFASKQRAARLRHRRIRSLERQPPRDRPVPRGAPCSRPLRRLETR